MLEWSADSTANKILCHGSTFDVKIRLQNLTCETQSVKLQHCLGTKLRLEWAPRNVCLIECKDVESCEPQPKACEKKKPNPCSCAPRPQQQCEESDSDSEEYVECEEPGCKPQPIQCQVIEASAEIPPFKCKTVTYTLYVTECFPLPCSTTMVKLIEFNGKPTGQARKLFLGATPLKPKPFYIPPN